MVDSWVLNPAGLLSASLKTAIELLDIGMDQKRKQALYWYFGLTLAGFLLIAVILPAIF